MSRLLDIHRFRRERRPVRRHVPVKNKTSVANVTCSYHRGQIPSKSPLAEHLESRLHMGVYYRVDITFNDGRLPQQYFLVPVSSGEPETVREGYSGGVIYNVNSLSLRHVLYLPGEGKNAERVFFFFYSPEGRRLSYSIPNPLHENPDNAGAPP